MTLSSIMPVDHVIVYVFSYLPAILLGLFFWWIDRFERKSLSSLALAFLWGAVGAAVLSILANSVLQSALNQYQYGLSDINTVLGSVVVAPFFEELTKGIFLLVLFWQGKIKDVTDGILWGLVIGLGFAASENAYYATEVVLPNSGELAMWYNLGYREVHTTLLHASATALWGVFLGYAAHIEGSLKNFALLNGLFLATLMHGFWNFLGTYVGQVTTAVNIVDVAMKIELVVIFGGLALLFVMLQRKKLKASDSKHSFWGLAVIGLILALTMFSYRHFMRTQVLNTPEYRAAQFFLNHSKDLAQVWLELPQHFVFTDVRADEKQNYGVSEIFFEAQWSQGVQEPVKVTLVKLADFWMVYEVVLSPGLPIEYRLEASYPKILSWLQNFDLVDAKEHEAFFSELSSEIMDEQLIDYLRARSLSLRSLEKEALVIWEELLQSVEQAKSSVLFEKGLTLYRLENFPGALQVFERLTNSLQRFSTVASQQLSGFDALRQLFDPYTLYVESQKMYAEALRRQEKYPEALQQIQSALDVGEKQDLHDAKSSSRLVKALVLFDMANFAQADQVFQTVIVNPHDENLTRKAWAWYYRGVIADITGADEDALDYFETAVGLQPYNSVFRKSLIEYLLNRSFVGDYELALGYALRGLDYEVEKSYFKSTASRIYLLLGLEDRTVYMN